MGDKLYAMSLHCFVMTYCSISSFHYITCNVLSSRPTLVLLMYKMPCLSCVDLAGDRYRATAITVGRIQGQVKQYCCSFHSALVSNSITVTIQLAM